MDLQPRSLRTIETLLEKGVSMPNPLTVDIGPEVDPDRVSGDGVTIYPGCRIYGAKTVLSAGVTLGAEGPVTVDNCRLGPDVALKGGYAAKAVFLRGANLGLGHHVREGTLLEEEANGAHCVGLKQTILFPFVTLGSLINFCDCLMAGGTSRKNHSEVGSSYIHFNFTPSGDKTTPSLFGDVARGVMLDQRPVFLGGQGGAVGPVRVGYGSVIAAGSVLRSDVADDVLSMPAPLPGGQVANAPASYRAANRLAAKNLLYIAELRALQEWYEQVRQPFFVATELGGLVYDGALEMLAAAVEERVKRLTAMVAKVPAEDDARSRLKEGIDAACAVAGSGGLRAEAPQHLLDALGRAAAQGVEYTAAVQALSPQDREAGTRWLSSLVDECWAGIIGELPALAKLPRT